MSPSGMIRTKRRRKWHKYQFCKSAGAVSQAKSPLARGVGQPSWNQLASRPQVGASRGFAGYRQTDVAVPALDSLFTVPIAALRSDQMALPPQGCIKRISEQLIPPAFRSDQGSLWSDLLCQHDPKTLPASQQTQFFAS